MYEDESPVGELVHLYIDGAFSRRELVSRVIARTGSAAAAMAALSGYEELNAQATPVPPGVRVPEDAPDIVGRDVEYPGGTGRQYGYLAYPRQIEGDLAPGIIVLHENRGLVEHIRDVTRRFARAGYVALAPDLLSRQGGSRQFTEPTQQTAAYGRTTQFERRIDIYDALTYIKTLPNIVFDRIGITGYCAGGGNIWDFIVDCDELAAAVPFYGAPPAETDMPRVRTPVLAVYAERDRGLTQRMLPIALWMVQQQKTMGMLVYEGVGHAFHNDTGAAYNAGAAQDAFKQTVAFMAKWLRRPRA